MELIITLIIIYVLYKAFSGSSKKVTKVPEMTVRFETTYSGGRNHEQPRGKPAKWYKSGESVTVNGYSIPGGLIYVGDVLLDDDGYSNDACLINPKLKVSPAEPWECGDEMDYWSEYGEIPARCRGSYLKWLATGRQEPEANLGYVFLFFYGLERRLMVDGQKGDVSGNERVEIVNEVRRLLKIYGGNRSFRGYANSLLAMEWILYQNNKHIPPYLDLSDRYCAEPFKVILAQHVAENKPIAPEMALQWLTLHPDYVLRTAARRCAKEFRELFYLYYTEKFGEGLRIKPNKTPLNLYYNSASPSLNSDLKLRTPSLPNPFILNGPLKKIGAIVEECTSKLDAYSRYIGRKNSNPTSMTALALLPKELVSKTPVINALSNCFKQACSNGPGMVDIASIYHTIIELPPVKLQKKDCETLAILAESLGYGMAPDIRYHNIKPNQDGQVTIFQKGHGIDFRPSKEFRTIGAILRLGAMVSQIDDDISPLEEAVLHNLVQDNRELSGIEKDSLLAFLYWCLRTTQSTAGVKQQFAQASKIEKDAISHILISVAHADGRIDPKEVKQLERLYNVLGLDKKRVTSDLHALAASSEPVTVVRRDPDTSYSIPKPTPASVTAKGFQLNEELIRIREEETRQVKGVLEGIFCEEIEEDAIVSQVTKVDEAPLAALDEAHKNLFNRLIAKETWDRSALHEMCNELDLMANGALEVLNEWAFVNANAPLIDDGEPIYVDVSLAKEIINA